MNTDLMFSSENSKWETDYELLEKLAPEFSWDIDLCADRKNVCSNFISPEQDMFKSPHRFAGLNLGFMNPPYTRKIGDWLDFASAHASYSDHNPFTVVCLVPARTDTIWFQRAITNYGASWVTFIKGRLKFGSDEYWANHWTEQFNAGELSETELGKKLGPTVSRDSAPFPSALIVYGWLSIEQETLLMSLGWSIDY